MSVETREERLAEVIEDLAKMRKEWDELGKPMMVRSGSTLEMRPHPLVKMIREAEEMIERMSRPVEMARGGRSAGAQSAPDRKREGPPKRASMGGDDAEA